ncbi:DUF2520 domain-containing protein [Bacteroides sp. OttesenSCG-928-D19]|nr:DUF2520 domain-containing protein [Bacteroides sp. OttesenSCG-928-N06]MDL2305146.1 DUF2520 domain-containing protein [Bacteroides sp. OttesenSCG-928-D19]
MVASCNQGMQNVSVVIVGAGNLAVNLARALYNNGFCIAQIYSRTEEAARSLAQKVNAGFTTDIAQITTRASVYFVALTDSALTELAPQLAKGREQGLWVHTAGSIPANVWQGYAPRYGVFYPMQTFSKSYETDFRQLSIFVEAHAPGDAEILKCIALSLTDKVYEVDSNQRKKLHLAAVFACNFANHMYTLSARVLEDAGIPFESMLPLIDETARKVHHLPPQQAQTGPAVRADVDVINEHLSMLNAEMQTLYKQITQSICQQ